MNALLVRLKPYDPRRGFVLRRYTYRGIKFHEERGWYRVDEDVGEYLRSVRQVPGDEHAPLAFDVHTEAEAKAIEPVFRHDICAALEEGRPVWKVDFSPDWLTVWMEDGTLITIGRYSGSCTFSRKDRPPWWAKVPVGLDAEMLDAALAKWRAGDPLEGVTVNSDDKYTRVKAPRLRGQLIIVRKTGACVVIDSEPVLDVIGTFDVATDTHDNMVRAAMEKWYAGDFL